MDADCAVVAQEDAEVDADVLWVLPSTVKTELIILLFHQFLKDLALH